MLVCRIKHIPYVTQFELRFYAIYTTKVLTKYYSITYNISIVSSKHRRNFRVEPRVRFSELISQTLPNLFTGIPCRKVNQQNIFAFAETVRVFGYVSYVRVTESFRVCR